MLAKRPPMGWNSWNTFGADISEALILETADAMVEKGYRDAGYEYVVIDDCWALHTRDEAGRLAADPEKFPRGMKFLADSLHAKGLKFGMYSCAGTHTCAGYPSSYDHEYTDAQTFADWGVDFLKYDFCNFPANADCKSRYLRMSMALKATGRDILFSACNWGVEEPWKWMASVGVQMYRSTGDINDNFKSVKDIAVSQIPNLCMSGAGCFNDPDMLVVGMYGKGNVGFGGCSDLEYKTHFALWCLFGVPLMMGGDIRNLNETSRLLLQNRQLIALNQDEECRPPYLACQRGDIYTFFRHLSDGEFAVGCFNLGDNAAQTWVASSCSLADFGIPYDSGYGLTLTDMFTGEPAGFLRDVMETHVEPHGCILYRGRLTRA